MQYAVKEEYKDVAVLAKIEELGKEDYYLVSDAPKSFLCSLKCSIYDLKGVLLSSSVQTFNSDKDSVQKITSSSLIQSDVTKSYVVVFEWNDANGKMEKRTFSHLAAKRKKTNAKAVTYSLENVNKITKTATLVILNSDFLADFWVSSNVLGVTFSENFMNYLPGKQTVQIQYTGDIIDLKQFKFFWR